MKELALQCTTRAYGSETEQECSPSLLRFSGLAVSSHEFANKLLQFIAFNKLHPFAYLVVAKARRIIGFNSHYFAFPRTQVQVIGSTGVGSMISQVVKVLSLVGRRENDIEHARIDKAQVVGHKWLVLYFNLRFIPLIFTHPAEKLHLKLMDLANQGSPNATKSSSVTHISCLFLGARTTYIRYDYRQDLYD